MHNKRGREKINKKLKEKICSLCGFCYASKYFHRKRKIKRTRRAKNYLPKRKSIISIFLFVSWTIWWAQFNLICIITEHEKSICQRKKFIAIKLMCNFLEKCFSHFPSNHCHNNFMHNAKVKKQCKYSFISFHAFLWGK